MKVKLKNIDIVNYNNRLVNFINKGLVLPYPFHRAVVRNYKAFQAELEIISKAKEAINISDKSDKEKEAELTALYDTEVEVEVVTITEDEVYEGDSVPKGMTPSDEIALDFMITSTE